MKEKNAVIKMQFRHMLSRTEFKVSLTAVLLVVAISFLVLCTKVWGLDFSNLYSAAYGWVGNAAPLDINIMQMFFVLLIFFVGSMAFSDSQYVDGKINAKTMIITRCSRKNYIISGAFVSFLGAFLVIFVPFIFSQLLSFSIFPVQSSVQTVFNSNPSWVKPYRFDTLFPSLTYNNPYLYNLISIFYMSVCAGIFAVLSFCLSFFIKRGRLLIIGIPTILVFVEDFIFPGSNSFTYYLYMGGIRNMSIYMYLGVPIGVLTVCCLLIFTKINRIKDELA